MWLVWIAKTCLLLLFMSSHVLLMKFFSGSCGLVYPSAAKYDGLTCFCLKSLCKAKSQVPLQGWKWNALLLLQFFSGPSVGCTIQVPLQIWKLMLLIGMKLCWNVEWNCDIYRRLGGFPKLDRKIKFDMFFPLGPIYWLFLKSFIQKKLKCNAN